MTSLKLYGLSSGKGSKLPPQFNQSLRSGLCNELVQVTRLEPPNINKLCIRLEIEQTMTPFFSWMITEPCLKVHIHVNTLEPLCLPVHLCLPAPQAGHLYPSKTLRLVLCRLHYSWFISKNGTCLDCLLPKKYRLSLRIFY